MVGFSLTTIFQKNNIINNSYFGVQTLAILTCKIKNNNIIHNGYKETFSKSINAWTSPYIDARNNWWGTEKGPSVFGFNDRPKIGLYLSIVRVRPWLMEPIPDAGRQIQSFIITKNRFDFLE
jgi:hypothetical protein